MVNVLFITHYYYNGNSNNDDHYNGMSRNFVLEVKKWSQNENNSHVNSNIIL